MPATQAKRKATADIIDSPPKRVTRARGKATEETEFKSTATKTTAVSSKAAAAKNSATGVTKTGTRKTKAAKDQDVTEVSQAAEQPIEKPIRNTGRQKKAAASTKPSKSNARAEEGEFEVADQEMTDAPTITVDPPKPEPKARGRQKKAATGATDAELAMDTPKARTRQPKKAPQETVQGNAPKTRGRPKKTTEPEPVSVELEDQFQQPAPVKKTTRARAAATAAKTAPKSAAAATKKKVTFDEEPDKENIPLESSVPRKSAMKATGMKAKPVRKPAATRGSTRGRKGTRQISEQEPKKRQSMPLSPKKANQVAKSDPASSEDELAGAKTPIRALSKSPTKRPMSPIKDFGSVSRLSFSQHAMPSSPAKMMSSSILASPAKRPPPSPFKDALKSSPKKLNLGDSVAKLTLLSSQTPMKASLLQESPKRCKLVDSALKPTLISSKSPSIASLLQSPARRPNASPKKLKLGSPEKAQQPPPVFDIKSPIKQTGSREKSQLSREQEDTELLDSIPTVNSHVIDIQPISSDKAMQPEMTNDSERQLVITGDSPAFIQDVMDIDQTLAGEGDAAGNAPDLSAYFTAPAFKIGSAALRRVSVESESEDELASPEKRFEVAPFRNHGLTATDFGTPIETRNNVSLTQKTANGSLLFTPLADQLSSWTASSPDKQSLAGRSRQARGIFSIGRAETPAATATIDDVVVDPSPPKSSFFDDDMVMREGIHSAQDQGPVVENVQEPIPLHISQESQVSDDYGDENALPTTAEMIREEQDSPNKTLTCTPANVFTPARAAPQQPREFHTVSKVPLRASADESSLRVPRQRSRSFGAALSESSRPFSKANTEIAAGDQPATPLLAATTIPQTPSSGVKLDVETPVRTVRKKIVPDLLQGAVVYVDVHTSEGADASGIFVDLLNQMGARCVKQWSWNPRASMGSSLESTASLSEVMSPDTSKVGITHVVYKDGGKRTLEKVRSSDGVVQCVGVGWVLE